MALEYDRERVHQIIRESQPWYRNPGTIKLYLLLLSPLVTSSSWGFDMSMTNSLQSVSQFMDHFNNPTGSRLGFYGAAASIGGIVAIFIGGTLIQTLGRRACCLVGSALVIAMALMETFSTSFDMFTAGKLVVGLGANVMQLGGPVLVMELAHPKSRVALSSLYNTNLYTGLVIGAWITFGTFSMNSAWSWKIPCILQIALPTYQFLTIYFCPESPRWLVTKGRVEEARRILIKYHGNGIETDLVKVEMQEILASVEADATELKFNKEGLRTIFATRGNLHRLWISFVTAVGSQCVGSTLITAYLPDIVAQVGFSSDRDKTLINGLVQIASWVASIAGALAMPYVRRRTFFLVDTATLLVIFVIWTALSAMYQETGKSSYGLATLVMIFLFNMTYCACWIPLVIVYPLETVTNKQRSIFFAWMYFCINASSFVIQYINPIGLENISWRYYIIECIFIASLIVIMYVSFVETHGYTLEEIAVLFDGEEAFSNMAAVHAAEMEKGGNLEVEETVARHDV